MAIHPSFPQSPFQILDPDDRWFPADEALRESSYEKLLPPLVHKIRHQVKAWRADHYQGASETSKALLNWWFNNEHLIPKSDGTLFRFKYYYMKLRRSKTNTI
jgi:type III restriction enzyme